MLSHQTSNMDPIFLGNWPSFIIYHIWTYNFYLLSYTAHITSWTGVGEEWYSLSYHFVWLHAFSPYCYDTAHSWWFMNEVEGGFLGGAAGSSAVKQSLFCFWRKKEMYCLLIFFIRVMLNCFMICITKTMSQIFKLK